MDRKGGGTPSTNPSEVLAREVEVHRLVSGVPAFAWENTSFFRKVFAPDRRPEVGRPPCYPAMAELAFAASSASAPMVEMPIAKRQKIRRVSKVTWQETCRSAIDQGVALWTSILVEDLSSSAVGCKLLADREAKMDTNLESIVGDFVGGKASSTVILRAQAYARYVGWLKSHDIYTVYVQEVHAYQYAKHLEELAKPSSVGSFLSSLAFAGHVFGLEGALSASGSGRIRGISDKMLANRPRARRAAPLTVEQVKLLEAELEFGLDKVQRVFAGHCLCLLWLRARWSDGQSIWNIRMDAIGETGGYLEATAEKTKTSRKARARGFELPLCGPAGGMSGNRWFKCLVEARAECGLEMARSKGKPFMPAVAVDGSFLDRPLSSNEATAWLIRIVGPVGSGSENIRSHSLKATLLSWVAKGGLSHDSRRLLGYHVSPNDKSMVTYSRDAMAGPLREMCRIVALVRDEQFFPDKTRSGYQPDEQATLPATNQEVKDKDAEVASVRGATTSDSSSSSSDESVDSSSDLRRLACLKCDTPSLEPYMLCTRATSRGQLVGGSCMACMKIREATRKVVLMRCAATALEWLRDLHEVCVRVRQKGTRARSDPLLG